METVQWRDYLGNAIRYWEPRRILYNLLLAAIVVRVPSVLNKTCAQLFINP
jgi:hypothetical protein